MIKLIERYTELTDEIDSLFNEASELDAERQEVLEKLEASVDESQLRPITPKDVKPGQIVFGKGDDGWYVREISEVMYPKDPFKAWVANDGCRYGLEGSYVLK